MRNPSHMSLSAGDKPVEEEGAGAQQNVII